MRPALLFFLSIAATCTVGCGANKVIPDEDDEEIGDVVVALTCEDRVLEYAATDELPVEGRPVAATFDGETLVLATIEGDDVTLSGFDAATLALSSSVDVVIDGCELTSITNGPDGLLAMASCATGHLELHAIDPAGATTLVAELPPPEIGPPRADAHDGQLWLFDGQLYVAPLSAPGSYELLPHEPLAWGPTTSFDHVDDHHLYARDAFEGGMTNMLAIEDPATGERCLYDIEAVPGLTGMPGVMAVGHGRNILAIGPDGALARLVLQPGSPGS